ncbi:ATPase domain-containing protein [Hyphococcus sp.]|uniref:ATPase domain-containing protein n=1 Tax=Hyphococcus sp. TaxID=2038636 RepID=UPI0035C708D8
MKQISTGIEGLDMLMASGLPQGHMYLIRGEPGTGKTTMALQFLTAGARDGEKGLCFTLSQTADELQLIASSYGMELTNIEVQDTDTLLNQPNAMRQTVVNTAELELRQVLDQLKERLTEVKPARVVVDSLIDLRLRSTDVLAYRRLFRELMDLLVCHGTTAIFLDSTPEFGGDSQIAGLVHGVVTLQRALPGYGIAQRRLEINKLRGVAHAEGLHDFTITATGVRVFPRLSSQLDEQPPDLSNIPTGLAGLDELTCGGIPQGTSVMIYGQTGTGKSSLAGAMLKSAINRGEEAAAFLFEEHPKTFVARADALGRKLSSAEANGKLHTIDLRAGEVLPGEFVHRVLDEAERKQVKTVVIDSVNGYLTASALKDHALAQLNTLIATLRTRQVLTVLIVEQPGLLAQIGESLDISILSDCLILLRQYEARSSVRRSVAVMKMRTGPHLTEMRELVMEPGRFEIEPISDEDFKSMRNLHLMSSQAPV